MLKIYRIVDNTNGNIYIGKTKQKYLSKRLGQHRERMTCMSREIIKNGDYKIELIEETEDESRERYWIENTDCINKQIPGRTQKEWREDNKEKVIQNKKKYSDKPENKEKKKEYQKKHHEKNKDYQEEYRKKNKDKLSRQMKEWRKDNKDIVAKKAKIKHQKNRDKNLERMKLRSQNIRPYQISWGGRTDQCNNSLLKIDPNLFLYDNC